MKNLPRLKTSLRLCLVLVLTIAQFYAARPVRAAAEGISIHSLAQEDLNADGQPDVTKIDCAFATDHDIVYIVDGGGDMQPSDDWRVATDFRDDTWLYDIGADGSIQLIVVYKIEEGRPTAYVYDDRDNDGQVQYEQDGSAIKILESPYWTARILSGSDWVLPDGRVNLNVQIEIDGPVPTLDRAPEAYIRDWMKQDGLVDVEFEEVAGDDGIARYALKRLLTDSPEDWGFERAGLQSNEGRFPTSAYERAFFPLLPIPIDPQDPKYLELRYFDLPPILRIDWQKGTVRSVGLDGYPIGHGYHFNDSQYIIKGRVNEVAFESPQAYYDLADNRDPFAELHIRFFTHPPDDWTMYSLPGFENTPWQSVSYDWNLFNPGSFRWDFKLGLGGNFAIDSVIKFPDFSLRMVPFDQLPDWITDREWKMATFVAREGEGYESSEGIYEWQTDTGDDPEGNPERAVEARDSTHGYMLGVTTAPPDQYFQTARPGYRAERHLASPISPKLYFSPLDRKLHLLGAEAGVWNIDGQDTIRYANLDGDEYLDQWLYYGKDELQSQFEAAGPYLIYADNNEVSLKRTDVGPSLFEALPPRNHEEWSALRDKLEANQPNLPAGDLKAMLTQFSEPDWRLEGGSIHGFRPDGKGFRFVLELQPGFRISGSGGPELSDLEPGSYVVSYQDSFHVEKVSPPSLSAWVVPIQLTQFQPAELPIAVRNEGLEDLPEAEIQLWATSPEGSTSREITQTVTLLGQTTIQPEVQWVPRSAGEWTLTPVIRQPDGQLIVGDPLQVPVTPAKAADFIDLVPVSVPVKLLPFIAIGLIAFAGIGSMSFYQAWKRSLSEGKKP